MESQLPSWRILEVITTPVANTLGLRALPYHVHEIILATVFYHFIFVALSPCLSTLLVPRIYNRFSRKDAFDWNMQWVSMIQSLLICGIASWTMTTDPSRGATTPEIRVWGYSGAAGTVQAFATGYFLWDAVVSVWHRHEVGLPSLIHAFSCLAVYLLGFRPIFNYYSCIFVLFELSTPFLDIHRFLDQLNMQGSSLQLVNGILLMITFFCVRLLYGFYWSFHWYSDILTAFDHKEVTSFGEGRFKSRDMLPWWVIIVFAASNIALNSLNVVWFGMMVKKVTERGPERTVKEE